VLLAPPLIYSEPELFPQPAWPWNREELQGHDSDADPGFREVQENGIKRTEESSEREIYN